MNVKYTGAMSIVGIVSRYLLLLLWIFESPGALAQQGDDLCDLASLRQAFTQYTQATDREQVRNIQNQLNSSGYGPVAADGTIGPDTRRALQRLCLDYRVEPSDEYALQLVGLLEMTTVVSQKHADWRRLIRTDAFKQWLDQMPLPQKTEYSNTLQSGPAVQIATILDGYPGDNPDRPVKKPAAVPVATKKAALVTSGPSVFYRWQPDEEAETPPGEAGTELMLDAEPFPDGVNAVLTTMQGIAYPNETLFKQALKYRFAEAGVQRLPYLDRILQQSRVGPVDKFDRIHLSGGGCGCSRDFSGLVYGFYPFWLATEEIQQVDFSLFDRIGFYALSLNSHGNIQNTLQWSDEWNIAAFIGKAHKFRVEVDLSIYASDWQQWSDKVMDNAARNVSRTVLQKFHADEVFGLRAVLPFIEDTSAVATDGVTLIFSDYTDSADSDKIVSFVTRVAEKLADAGSDARLNVMLGLDNKSIENSSLFENLAGILLDQEGSKVTIDYVFVFMQEPTSDSKKNLRRTIENAFHGLDRKTALRKMVPVLSPTGHDRDPKGAFTQFTDDLIYLQDNFAGVGLWPLPLDSHENMHTIRASLIDIFRVSNNSNLIAGMINGYAPWLCEFACPNRWLFRLGFDLLAGLLLVYALFAIWICKLRSLYTQYWLYFLAVGLVTVSIMLIAMVCDPFWQQRADSVVMTVFLLALVVTIWRYVNRLTQPPLP